MAWRPRLVALDIDGTLLGFDGRVPRSIATGVDAVKRRSWKAWHHSCPELPLTPQSLPSRS